jgi:hypothetical protein
VCGDVVAVLEGRAGSLVWCGEEKKLDGKSDAKDFPSGLLKIGAL